MIIGNGMLAKAFLRYGNNNSVLVFASGVANSRERDRTAFEREETKLRDALRNHPYKTFIYFGTCSVVDPNEEKSPYVLHKLQMENIISNGHSRHIIFRLPQVVGKSANRTTLVNYFYDMISKGEPFTVWKNATRYLIDAEDVVKIASYIIDSKTYLNCTINIAALRYPVVEIVRLLEKISGIKGVYTVVEKGIPFSVDVAFATRIADELKIEFNDGYLERMLFKYFSPANHRH